MRIQPVRIPDALDRRRRESLGLGHRATRPLRRPWRCGLGRRLDDRFDLGGRNLRLSAPTRGDLGQRDRAAFLEAFAPQDHRRARDLELFGDGGVRPALTGEKDDPRAQYHRLRGLKCLDPALEQRPVFLDELHADSGVPHGNIVTESQTNVKLLVRHYTSRLTMPMAMKVHSTRRAAT